MIRVVELRLLAATIPMMPITTIAPTTIHSHGIVVVVVVVVEPSVVVVVLLSVVLEEPLPFGALIVPLPFEPLVLEPLLLDPLLLEPLFPEPFVVEPLVAGPVVVVVVEPDEFVVCARVIAGAMARNSARNMRLSRKIGRISDSPSERVDDSLLPRKLRSENTKQGFAMRTPARTAVCTIVARNYIALARSLLASVAQFEPSIDRFVFFLDDVAGVETFAEGSVLRPADVFDRAAYAALAHAYDVVEFATAVKPTVLRHLLDRGYERVLYLDPDIQVFAPLDAVLEPLETNDIVLTPHVTESLPVDLSLHAELALLRTGVFNLGFAGVANRPAARDMLDWWEEHLARFSRNDVSSGLFVDQRWIDLVPGMFGHTAIVRHRGCNVAYWNLRTRRLAAGDELRLETGEPVIFFHFSGFEPRRPDRLCAHPMRIDVNGEPRLRQLLADYAQRLIEYGHFRQHRFTYAYGRFAMRPRLRELFRHYFRLRSAWLYRRGVATAKKGP